MEPVNWGSAHAVAPLVTGAMLPQPAPLTLSLGAFLTHVNRLFQVFDFVGTDMSDREFELLLEDMRAQAASAGVGAALSREALLKRVFQALDKDNSG